MGYLAVVVNISVLKVIVAATVFVAVVVVVDVIVVVAVEYTVYICSHVIFVLFTLLLSLIFPFKGHCCCCCFRRCRRDR